MGDRGSIPPGSPQLKNCDKLLQLLVSASSLLDFTIYLLISHLLLFQITKVMFYILVWIHSTEEPCQDATSSPGSTQLKNCVKLMLLVSASSFVVMCLILGPQHSSMVLPWFLDNTPSHNASSLPDFINVTESYTDEITTQIQMEAMEKMMAERRQNIQRICGITPLSPFMAEAKLVKTIQRMYISRKYNVAYCPIFKAGSSSWLEVFANMAGVLTERNRKLIARGKLQVNNLARKAYPKNKSISEEKNAVMSATRFIIVRHPFERLLSAYRDKLENKARREYYYNRYGRHIVQLYRTHKDLTKRPEPTFHEFLSYVSEKQRFDEHWRPYHLECSPCVLDYQVIIKMESMDSEEKYLVNKLGLESFVAYSASSRRHKNMNPSGRTGSESAMKYYAQVPRELMQKLYKLYSSDFTLFGYYPTEYYEMSKDSKEQLGKKL
uniref:Carbohydrate sulfotransferase n=1 Tax=Timema shepardi TaxID=629360 RepID=A0A7R9G3E2_TIMSH|nr:unnamed protein product [Timema shepardi]